jgi:sulfur carrier protein
MTSIVLNGTQQDLPDGATIESAVLATGAPAEGRGVAVVVDGEVVPRGEWSNTPVREGQQVEVLNAVQGGA